MRDISRFAAPVAAAMLTIPALATAARAQFLTDPTPARVVTADAIEFRKELTGYPNYGSDGAADILYTGNTGVWTFDLTAEDLALAAAPPVFTAVMALDDHYAVPPAAYAFAAAINGVPVSGGGQGALAHGAPFDTVFTNWAGVDFSGVPLTAGTNTLRLTNLSATGTFDWIAVDRIRLTIPTAAAAAVPESGSLALALPVLGMVASASVGTAVIRRRKSA